METDDDESRFTYSPTTTSQRVLIQAPLATATASLLLHLAVCGATTEPAHVVPQCMDGVLVRPPWGFLGTSHNANRVLVIITHYFAFAQSQRSRSSLYVYLRGKTLLLLLLFNNHLNWFSIYLRKYPKRVSRNATEGIRSSTNYLTL